MPSPQPLGGKRGGPQGRPSLRFRRRGTLLLVGIVLALSLLQPALELATSGYTRIELTDARTGSQLLTVILHESEPITLTWKNSLFGVDVTEVFLAKDGLLVQTQVTYAGPQGTPPSVSPRDVEDLYHTGGPFSAQGLSKPFRQILFRVGEVGRPRLYVRDRVVDFQREVGFGGRVLLVARPSTWRESLLHVWTALCASIWRRFHAAKFSVGEFQQTWYISQHPFLPGV